MIHLFINTAEGRIYFFAKKSNKKFDNTSYRKITKSVSTVYCNYINTYRCIIVITIYISSILRTLSKSYSKIDYYRNTNQSFNVLVEIFVKVILCQVFQGCLLR